MSGPPVCREKPAFSAFQPRGWQKHMYVETCRNNLLPLRRAICRSFCFEAGVHWQEIRCSRAVEAGSTYRQGTHPENNVDKQFVAPSHRLWEAADLLSTIRLMCVHIIYSIHMCTYVTYVHIYIYIYIFMLSFYIICTYLRMGYARFTAHTTVLANDLCIPPLCILQLPQNTFLIVGTWILRCHWFLWKKII